MRGGDKGRELGDGECAIDFGEGVDLEAEVGGPNLIDEANVAVLGRRSVGGDETVGVVSVRVPILTRRRYIRR